MILEKEFVLKFFCCNETQFKLIFKVDEQQCIEDAISCNQVIIEQSMIIIQRIDKWAGSRFGAVAWFTSETIPSLAYTPLEAIQDGYFDAVIQYIEAIELGGYA
jgi:hypothetical protein